MNRSFLPSAGCPIHEAGRLLREPDLRPVRNRESFQTCNDAKTASVTTFMIQCVYMMMFSVIAVFGVICPITSVAFISCVIH